MNNKPINLTLDDFTQTRLNGYHASWPTDPETTARLKRVIHSDPFAASRRSLARPYAIVGALLIVVFGVLILAVRG